ELDVRQSLHRAELRRLDGRPALAPEARPVRLDGELLGLRLFAFRHQDPSVIAVRMRHAREAFGLPGVPHPNCDHGWVLVPKGEQAKAEQFPVQSNWPRFRGQGGTAIKPPKFSAVKRLTDIKF